MTGVQRDDDLAGAALRASGAALAGAVGWSVLGGPLDLRVGLLVVAVFVGWLIGTAARGGATRRGARARGRRTQEPSSGGRAASGSTSGWGERTPSEPTAPDTAGRSGSDPVRLIAVAAAVAAWLLALVAIYVYSLAVIPGLPGTGNASSDLGARLQGTPILTFYAQSFGLLDAIEGAVLVAVAWWTSR